MIEKLNKLFESRVRLGIMAVLAVNEWVDHAQLKELLGVTDGDNPGIGAAFAVLAAYVVFGLVALAIDRRALLVSALAYVLFALTFLFREFGAVELNFALTALLIGSALLSLSAFWQPIRRGVVNALPAAWQEKLPVTGDVPVAMVETPSA